MSCCVISEGLILEGMAGSERSHASEVSRGHDAPLRDAFYTHLEPYCHAVPGETKVGAAHHQARTPVPAGRLNSPQ